jgi:uncharacterized protein (DUF486 family)
MNKGPAIALTICLLILSSCIMIVAWYLHLKFADWPLWKAILFSWLIAAAEYALQVPANRIGHTDAQMNAAQLRSIAEIAILTAFILFSTFVLKEPLRVNHLVGFAIVCFGVWFVVAGPLPHVVYDGSVAEVPTEEEISNSTHFNIMRSQE